MRLERLELSRQKPGQVLACLEDGTVLRLTERELLAFSLHPGEELDGETLEALRTSASDSGTKAQAAALIGRRAMSRSDLLKKLTDKGATETEARYACEWLEAIGALDDADYAGRLVSHCAQMGYGPARMREELRRHGIDRSLWEEALRESPEPSETIGRYLAQRFRGTPPDERELKRAADALARRGFRWEDVKSALRGYTDSLAEDV